MIVRCKIAFISVLFLLGGVCVASAADVAKIGLVDFQKVLDNSSAGKAAQAEINKKGEKMEVELEKMGKEIEGIKDKLEREALVMSNETREEKEREIRIKINDFKTAQKKYMQDFKEAEKELVRKIQKQVTDIVMDMGKKEGYLLILERRESGAVYFPDSIDLTDKVIELYNKKTASGG